jgi:N-acetylglucosaminyldiphosphoundecaprenol N-acetyl-beta-D-mannosaminyltransferase
MQAPHARKMVDARNISTQKAASSRKRVIVTGVAVDNLDADQVLSRIEELVAQPGAHYMAVVNAAKMVAARQDEVLRGILDGADIVTADGMSVVWASRLLGKPLVERVTGIDMLARLVEWAARRQLSVFFLGAKEEAVAAAVDHFQSAHPTLKVAGYRNGYFADADSQSITESIRLSRADLLFVGMGSPAQEKWIAANVAAAGVRFAMGVGGSFDHVCGRVSRAPLWMQRAGLEWLHRLAREPRRMWRRYLIGNTKFICLVAKQRWSRK